MHQRRWIQLFSDYDGEICYHPGKANVVADAFSRKERVKLRRVRAMSMTIQSSVKDKILVAQSKASKVKNATLEMLRGRDQQMEKTQDDGLYFIDRGWDSNDRRLQDDRLARIYIDEIVARHGVPVSIISDSYHPQTDGQSERTIHTLEDMLRACVIDFGGSWDTHLPLAEFSYNNSNHSSIQYAPFEALYGSKCRSPVLWSEVGENQLIRPEMVQETTDKVVLIKERLKAARDRQKSYADNRRKPLEFEVGDQVLLKVSPWKGVVRFGKKGKLAPR
ncbi:putative reverse transcriptase domain-containing protein [Tanacetum coccineum]